VLTRRATLGNYLDALNSHATVCGFSGVAINGRRAVRANVVSRACRPARHRASVRVHRFETPGDANLFVDGGRQIGTRPLELN
jgi:hypothetical protein